MADQEVRAPRLGDVACQVETEGDGPGIDLPALLVRQPPVHAAPALDLGVHALDRDLPDRRGDDMGALGEEVAPHGKGEGKGVDAEGGRGLPAARGTARVHRQLSGGEEEHKRQLSPGRQQVGVVRHQVAADRLGLLAVDGRCQPGVSATAEEPVEVIAQPVGLVVEGAYQVGHRRSQDHGGIVDRHVSLGSRLQSTSQKDEGLGSHPCFSPAVDGGPAMIDRKGPRPQGTTLTGIGPRRRLG